MDATESKPSVRILAAITPHSNEILAFDHELVTDAILYNGSAVEDIIFHTDSTNSVVYPNPLIPQTPGFWIWEGTVTFWNDGQEKWEGEWKKATEKEVLYFHHHGKLLPVINTLEEGLKHLQLTESYPQLLEITQQIFGVAPEVKIEESYFDFWQPYYAEFTIRLPEDSNINNTIDKEMEWHHIARDIDHGAVRLHVYFKD